MIAALTSRAYTDQKLPLPTSDDAILASISGPFIKITCLI